jgi:endonuclease/exonuclease/phosphatase family metal-dependent hydrolase
VNEIGNYTTDYPVILTGDFNYTSTADGYKIITSKLFDSKYSSKTESFGGNITFNGFGNDIKPDNKIDFIFANDKVEVLNHIIDTTTFNGLYPSDHFPVITEILLK